MQYEISLKGDKKLLDVLTLMSDKADKVFAQALYEEALLIFNEAQKLTPIDTGALRGSGYISQPVTSGGVTELEISYGGVAAPYALYVHEIINAPSGKLVYHRPPTQAKFLSVAVDRAISGFGRRLLGRVGHILKGK